MSKKKGSLIILFLITFFFVHIISTVNINAYYKINRVTNTIFVVIKNRFAFFTIDKGFLVKYNTFNLNRLFRIF